MTRPIIGRHAPMPRPIARRMSDLAPYASLDAVEPGQWDTIIGRVCAVLLVVVLTLLAGGAL